MRERPDAELLAAYVDGVTELSVDERRRVEELLARTRPLRDEVDATRALLGELRALPPVGGEPDWTALERSISDAVGRDVPRPWYARPRWRWIVPGVALAMATAGVALVMHRPPAGTSPAPVAHAPRPSAATEPEAAQAAATVPLWLDGNPVELDVDASHALLEVHEHAGALDVAHALLEVHERGGDLDATLDAERDGNLDPILDAELGATGAPELLPASDLEWVDALDDGALELAEQWLAKPAGSGGPS